jgi:hypothetical protein
VAAGEDGVDGLVEGRPVVAEDRHQAVVPDQPAGDQVPVEAADLGRVDGQLEAQAVRLELAPQGGELEFGGHGVGQLAEQGRVGVGPRAGGPAVHRQHADRGAVEHHEGHAEVGGQPAGGDHGDRGQPRVAAGVRHHQRLGSGGEDHGRR